MKLTGPACTEALSEAEEAGRRERAEDSAGGVRVELRVRPKTNKHRELFEYLFKTYPEKEKTNKPPANTCNFQLPFEIVIKITSEALNPNSVSPFLKPDNSMLVPP